METRGDQSPAPGPWWKHAVCYQVYVRSFADADGDGVGDLPGITSRLPHLAELGVDALWITPFYPSPQHDHGYDVADYCDVNPEFGRLEDVDKLITEAHGLDIRVIIDLVPNHTSSKHPWFEAALAAGPGSPERARYVFREGRDDGPPNNWRSVFGGPAWTQVPDGQWYLHLFDTNQPDLDWTNPEVPAMFEDVLRFWLDRGVDGFRIDVAHGLFKEEGLPDQRLTAEEERAANLAAEDESMVRRRPGHEPMWDQPGVHDVYRSWRSLVDSYDGDRMLVGEAWTRDAEALARYIRPDELHQSFNFHWLTAPWSAAAFREVITETLAAVRTVGASATWVLSNHDVVRHPTRYGGGAAGLARARAATMTMLALPGSAYVYQGEELGLEEVDVAPEDRRDPRSLNTGQKGRDGCRVPIPWSGTAPPYGFGPSEGQPWLPQPEDWGGVTVEAQDGDDASTLAFYRRALRARRGFAETAGDLVEMLDSEPEVLAFRRGPLVCHLNTGSVPVDVPEGEVVLCSGREPGAPDTATWLRQRSSDSL
jgi:alpha-glucosidase